MLTPYAPLDFMESLAQERRIDPRLLAASGSATPAPSLARRRISRALIRLGHWIEGGRPQTAPAANQPC